MYINTLMYVEARTSIIIAINVIPLACVLQF